MSDETLIKVEGASKKFCRSLKRSLWYGVKDVASELFDRRDHHHALRINEFWAVKDLSFELESGECLGLIGPNGAGKSTLLKMLNGLIKPDGGRIVMNGRVGALIELGAGFNPILTARENIYINASVLGLSKKEIDRKFDDIVDFAEVDEFIDSPVQNFSSGMKVRLGFAVAAQLEPDILIVDEVLAVGDASFRLKCMNRISEISRNSAVIIVSHSMPMISRMASRVLLMDKGCIEYSGKKVQKGIEKYLASTNLTALAEASDFFILTSLRISTPPEQKQDEPIEIQFADDVAIEMQFTSKKNSPEFLVNVSFIDMENKMVAQCFSHYSDFIVRQHHSSFTVSLDLLSFNLNPGRYSVQIDLVEALEGHRRGVILYKNPCAAQFSVVGNLTGWAPVQFLARWSLGSPDSQTEANWP